MGRCYQTSHWFGPEIFRMKLLPPAAACLHRYRWHQQQVMIRERIVVCSNEFVSKIQRLGVKRHARLATNVVARQKDRARCNG